MEGNSKNSTLPRFTGLVRTIRDCCQRQEGEMCRKIALTPAQFACLLAFPEKTSELKVNQVSAAMELSHSRASRIIDSLVRQGLLRRRTLDIDRRTQLVALTAAGQEKWQAAHEQLVECERRLLAHLPPTRSRELEEALKTLAQAWSTGLRPGRFQKGGLPEQSPDNSGTS